MLTGLKKALTRIAELYRDTPARYGSVLLAMKVYLWEAVCVFSDSPQPVDRESAQSVVNQEWCSRGHPYGLPAPQVRMESGTTCWGRLSGIHLSSSMLKRFGLPIVLHELAHPLALNQGHGPEFIRVYISLLAKWCRMDEAMLLGLARVDEMLEKTACDTSE